MTNVTRDADFPAEAAMLMQQISHLCDGHSLDHVIEAAGNFAIMAFHGYGRAVGDTKEQAMERARKFGEAFADSVGEQWDRQSQPSDVPVPHDAN